MYFKDGRGRPPGELDDDPNAFELFKKHLEDLLEQNPRFQVKDLKAVVERACIRRAPLTDILKAYKCPAPEPSEDFGNVGAVERDAVLRREYADKMLKRGWTGKQLAASLGIAHRTLQKHFSRLGLRSPRSNRKHFK